MMYTHTFALQVTRINRGVEVVVVGNKQEDGVVVDGNVQHIVDDQDGMLKPGRPHVRLLGL